MSRHLIYVEKLYNPSSTYGCLIEDDDATANDYGRAYRLIESHMQSKAPHYSAMLNILGIEHHKGAAAFNTGLSINGAYYTLVVPDSFNQEQVRKARASLYHTNDVVHLQVLRLTLLTNWQPPKPFRLVTNPKEILFNQASVCQTL